MSINKGRVFCCCLLLGTTLPAPGSSQAQDVQSRDLQEGWQFRLAPVTRRATEQPDASRWHPAHVPGSVQTDLLASRLIGEPYFRDNEKNLQWIGLSDWQYRLNLKVDAATLAQDHVELVFDGLDTFADVTLNGATLLHADNMFRRWRIPVKSVLHAGDNQLEVTLHSPIGRIQPWLAKQSYALPGEFDSAFGDEPVGRQSSNYVRKANYQYGWDWGPRFITEGIWRPVRLESWSGPRLVDVHIAQPHVDANLAQLQAQVEVSADQASKAQVALRWTAPDGKTGNVQQDVSLKAGDNVLTIPLRIEHPQRWWPVGYGAPDRYRFQAVLSVDGKPVATQNRITGLRSVALLRQKDQWGRSFGFLVNGVPIFAKGANFIPADDFPERVTPARVQQILQSARDANMNMLRVWGGGYYPDDAFYEAADRLGLMIWQEFMFGGAIPPYDPAYRDNTRVEAIEQVKRLRDHPSLVLWCGNNEVETSWESWSDRKKFAVAIGPVETTRVEQGMRTLFGDTLRGVVRQYDSDVPYWATSPGTDLEGASNQLTDGDYHSWGVWSGSKPIEHYLDETPRFQSEYGLQSFPVMATIEAFTTAADRTPESPVMRAHQKFDKGNGNQRLLYYIRKYYGEPEDFDAFVYLSQVMQAEGIELASDHLRSTRPQAMGSLYWQLNDVWPGPSWSSVDYYGRWKALQFHAARFYAPVRVAPIHAHGQTVVSVISDRTEPFGAQLHTRIMDMDGSVLHDSSQSLHLPALTSVKVVSMPDAQLLQGADPRHTVAVYTLEAQGQTLSRQVLYFAPALELHLPDPGLKAQVEKDGAAVVVDVSASKLAREVWLDFGSLDVRPVDNAFDLLPGEHVRLKLNGDADIDAIRRTLHLRSLAGATIANSGKGTP